MVACSFKFLRFHAVLFAFLAGILFLPTLAMSADDDSQKAASLRSVSLQLMDVGAEQLRRGYSAAAQQSLSRANENRQYLSASEQKKLDELLTRAGGVSVQHEKVYEKMRAADSYAKSKDYSHAISTLSSIQDSPYLSKIDKEQVQTNLKNYRAELKKQQENMATLYAQSVTFYNEGKLPEARKGFEQVASSGVPLVSTGPTASEYIAKIDEQTGKPAETAKEAAIAETKTGEEEQLLTEQSPKQPVAAAAPEEPAAKPVETVQAPASAEPSPKPGEIAESTVSAPVPAVPITAEAPKQAAQCAPAEGSYVDKVMQQRNVQRSYTEAVVDDAAANAANLMYQCKFDAAQDSISSARLVVENNKILLGDELYRQMTEKLDSVSSQISSRAAMAASLEQQQKQQQAATVQEQLRSQQEAERCQRINDLMTKAISLQRQQRYEDARGQLELLLAIDPLNEQALAMHQTITDMINFRKQIEVRKEIDDQTMATFLNADKAGIPHADEVTYPRDWREITGKRLPEEIAGMSAADVQVNKQLDTIVDLSKLNPDTSFGDAITILQDSVQPPLKVFVNWPDLQDNADITRLTRINMEPISGIPLRSALDLLLSAVSGGGAVKIGYVVENGVVNIWTVPSLPSKVYQRSYGIGDLLGIPADFFTDMTTTGLGQINLAATIGAGGTGGGGGGQRQQQQQTQTRQLSAAEIAAQTQLRIDQIVAMIQEIDPETWYINGGKGTVRIWGKSLIVVQTSDVHQKIVKLIEDLRTSAGLGQQVAIEARFLLVSENFLEDIGFDVDFTSIHLGGKWDPLVVQQDSIRSTTLTGDQPADIPTAARITGAYGGVLDDLQVQFLIKATQQAKNARSLQAPRVTVISGESATMRVTTDQSYISNVTTNQSAAGSTGTNAAAVFTTLQEDISTITSGVILNITPTISSDRKYVILRILTSTTNVLSLPDFTFTAAFQNGEAIPATIQVPEIQTTEVQTRVSVPDKGTLLLGGQKLTDESETESGVPVLGKIPIIGRLFENRSQTRDQKVLLILVTPTILLQEEKEAEAVATMRPPGI